MRVVEESGFWEVCTVGLCAVVEETTGFFVVSFENVAVVVSFVTFTVLGRRVEDKVDGFVGCLVVLGDMLDGIFTVVLVFFNVTSVLGPAAFCTVWNVERRVVCVVVSIVVIVGFFVTSFVVSLIVFAEVCVLCVLKTADVVYKIIKL